MILMTYAQSASGKMILFNLQTRITWVGQIMFP